MLPLKYRLSGGGYQLNAATRAAYFWRCQKLYCSKEANATFEDNIRQNMAIIFDATQKVLDDAAIPAAAKAALNAKLARIKGEDKGATLTTLNIKSLQCVILMTEISKLTNPAKSTMKDYPIKSIVSEYAALTVGGHWDNYDHLYNLIKTGPYLLSRYKKLIGTSYPEADYCCPNFNGARILVLLGEMTLLELVDTMADNIYLIGVTTEIEWADGHEYTPFEFMHHDLVHASNREYGFGDFGIGMLSLERRFIDHIKGNPGAYDLDKLMIPLFLLMHELPMGEMSLLREQMNFPLSYESRIKDTFVGNLENWRNPKFYGGLLPEAVRGGSDEEIIAYLDDCFTLLTKSWNTFFEGGGAGAGAGGAAAGANTGGRRRRRRSTKRKNRKSRKRRQ